MIKKVKGADGKIYIEMSHQNYFVIRCIASGGLFVLLGYLLYLHLINLHISKSESSGSEKITPIIESSSKPNEKGSINLSESEKNTVRPPDRIDSLKKDIQWLLPLPKDSTTSDSTKSIIIPLKATILKPVSPDHVQSTQDPLDKSLPTKSNSSRCAELVSIAKTSQTQNSVSYSWSAVSKATGYKVFYVRLSDNYISEVESISNTSHTFTGLQSGAYRFYFAAVCQDGTLNYAMLNDLILQ